jgi:hypothetical protein
MYNALKMGLFLARFMPIRNGEQRRRKPNSQRCLTPPAVRARSLAVVVRRFLDGLVAFCRALHPFAGRRARPPADKRRVSMGLVAAAGPLTSDELMISSQSVALPYVRQRVLQKSVGLPTKPPRTRRFTTAQLW